MNGQTMSYSTYSIRKYKESLLNTPEPVPFDRLPNIKMNLAALSRYARDKGVRVSDLSEEEKSRFINI